MIIEQLLIADDIQFCELHGEGPANGARYKCNITIHMGISLEQSFQLESHYHVYTSTVM